MTRAQSFCEGTQKSFERTGTPEFLAFPNAFPRLADELGGMERTLRHSVASSGLVLPRVGIDASRTRAIRPTIG